MNPSSTSSKPKILYVEDEIIVALDVSDALEHDLGFDVDVAHNLHSAKQLAERQDFDCALLDINLGHGERSTELGKTLSERGVKVVFASGYNREELDEAQDFPLIEKPFQVKDLRAVFAEVLPPSNDQRASAAE